MLVVLEGCDGVGKTTLANFLARLLNARVVHCTKDTPNDYDFFFDLIEKGSKENIIADRFFWGQYVYQPSDEWRLDLQDLHHLEEYLYDSGGKLILVSCDEETIKTRLGYRGETTEKPIEDILMQYECMVRNSACPVIFYNSETGGIK